MYFGSRTMSPDGDGRTPLACRAIGLLRVRRGLVGVRFRRRGAGPILGVPRSAGALACCPSPWGSRACGLLLTRGPGGRWRAWPSPVCGVGCGRLRGQRGGAVCGQSLGLGAVRRLLAGLRPSSLKSPVGSSKFGAFASFRGSSTGWAFSGALSSSSLVRPGRPSLWPRPVSTVALLNRAQPDPTVAATRMTLQLIGPVALLVLSPLRGRRSRFRRSFAPQRPLRESGRRLVIARLHWPLCGMMCVVAFVGAWSPIARTSSRKSALTGLRDGELPEPAGEAPPSSSRRR
jgi:hypothetical protein